MTLSQMQQGATSFRAHNIRFDSHLHENQKNQFYALYCIAFIFSKTRMYRFVRDK